RLALTVVPREVETDQGRVGQIGAYVQEQGDLFKDLRIEVSYGPLEAVARAVGQTWDMAMFTLRMLGRMVIGRASLENISGPITIAQFAGQTASSGGVEFLAFLALVSISLGVLNLLPIPILDGGHLLYYLIELVKGSPLPEAAQNFGQRLGIVLLLMLMGLALFNDISHLLRQ
ncbi:MAG: RIP metalloprotease RseP, partial [Pseudomonadota bacterium]|nr:RIP metalloprotease RseP [Pseudomonadota bacterium]